MSVEKPIKPREIEPPREGLNPRENDADLVIFARELNDGYGDYDASAVTVVKELREAGADAAYEHDEANARRWIGENALEVLVLDLIIGVIGNAAWAALVAVVLRRKSQRVRVRWTRSQEPETGLDVQWFEAEGSGEDVAQAMEALQPTESRQVRPEDEPEA